MKEHNFTGCDELYGLLDKELKIFKQILGLCEKQAELLGKGELEELDKSIEKVRELREQVDGLHQKTNTLMQSYALLPMEKKDSAIDGIMGEIQETIDSCASVNESNTDLAKTMIEEQTKKIEEQSTRRKRIGGYVQTIPNTSEMFDKKT